MSAKAKPHRQGWEGSQDPMEAIVEKWLIARGVSFTRDHPSCLDFYLPGLQLFIECKRFYTPRVNTQLERVRGNSVIVVQGIDAWEKLTLLLGDGGSACPNKPRIPDWLKEFEHRPPAESGPSDLAARPTTSALEMDENQTLNLLNKEKGA